MAGVAVMPERTMPDHAVALVLTFAEAGALFEAANVGLHRRVELGQGSNDKAIEAMHKIARGMGFRSKLEGSMVLLLPPMDS
jgi:hypothetical protein